ncbi:MAG TPA: protein kinase [Actinomycetes bacterium]
MEAGGRLLAGRYQLGRPLGASALGQVFEAADTHNAGRVALRVAHAQLAEDAGARAGFLRAAREAARLDHPNVVAVLGLGEDQGVPFVVMELVEGRTVRELQRTAGPAPAARAVEVAAQVCAALGAAHAQGLVHGGLTPGKVRLRPDGLVQVADFGLAALVAQGHRAAAYLSPEQVQSGRADDRSDLYALGCCLFELLTGEPPFDGPTPFVVMRRHLEESPRPPSTVRPELPAWLDEPVMWALAKHPAERPQTAAELRHALAQLPDPATQPVVPAVPVGVDEPVATGPPEHAAAGEPVVPVGTAVAEAAVGPRGPARAVAGEDEPDSAPARGDEAGTIPTLPGMVVPPLGMPPTGLDGLPPHEERVRALTRFAEPPRRRNRLALATIAVGLAIVVAASIGLVAPGLVFDVGAGRAADATLPTASTGATTAPAPTTPAPLQVPPVAGAARAEAVQRLRAAGATVGKLRLVRNPQVGKGQVLETNPPAGATLRQGQAVDLVVSNGSDPVTVSDLIAVIDAAPSRVGPRGRTYRGRLANLASLRGERRRLEIADLLRIARAGAGNGDFTPEFSRAAVAVLSRAR